MWVALIFPENIINDNDATTWKLYDSDKSSVKLWHGVSFLFWSINWQNWKELAGYFG